MNTKLINEELIRISQLMGVKPKKIILETEEPNVRKIVVGLLEKLAKKTEGTLEKLTDDEIKVLQNELRSSITSVEEISKLDKVIADASLTSEKKIEQITDLLMKDTEMLENIIEKSSVELKTELNSMYDNFIQKNPQFKRDLDDLYTSALDRAGGDTEIAQKAMREILLADGYPKSSIDRYFETTQVKEGSSGNLEVIVKDEFKIKDKGLGEDIVFPDEEPIRTLDNETLESSKAWQGETLVVTNEELQNLINRVNKSTWDKILSKFTNTEYEINRLRILTKSLTLVDPTMISVQDGLKRQIADSLEKVMRNSITDSRRFIEWLKAVRNLPTSSAQERKTIDELLARINNNDLLKTYGMIVEESKGKQILAGIKQGYSDAWDYFKNTAEFSVYLAKNTIGVIRGGWKAYMKPSEYLDKIKAEEALKNSIKGIEKNGDWWKNFYSGSRRGYPSIDNPNYKNLIEKYGKTAAYSNYIATLGFKYLKYSVLHGIVWTFYSAYAYFSKQETAMLCKAALKKIPIEDLKSGKYDVPSACQVEGFTDYIFLSAAIDYANDYERERGPLEWNLPQELWENCVTNLISEHWWNMYPAPAMKAGQVLYNIGYYTRGKTSKEILDALNKDLETYRQELIKLDEEFKKPPKPNQEIPKEDETVVDKVTDWAKEVTEKGQLKAFELWIKTQPGNPTSQGIDDLTGAYKASDGKLYVWEDNKFQVFNPN